MYSQSSELPSLAPNATVINIIPYSENQGASVMKENSINKNQENRLNGQTIKEREEIAQAINNNMNVINIIGYRPINNRNKEPEADSQDGNKGVNLEEGKNQNQIKNQEWETNKNVIKNGINNKNNLNGYHEYQNYNSEHQIEEVAENKNGYQNSDNNVDRETEVIEIMPYYVEEKQNGEQLPEKYSGDSKATDEIAFDSGNQNGNQIFDENNYTLEVNDTIYEEKEDLNMYF